MVTKLKYRFDFSMHFIITISIVLLSEHLTLPQENYWEPVTPIPDAIFSTMIFDSSDYLYATTLDTGFYISSNGGITWSTQQINCATSVRSVALHAFGDIYLGDVNCISRSSDHGNTWTVVNNNTMGNNSILINSTHCIFIGSEQDWRVGRLLRSTDDGLTWSDYDFPNLEVAYTLIENSKGDIFACTNNGIFRSTDIGDSWVETMNTGLTDRWISCAVINSNDILIAGTWGNGIFRSSNGGDNWQQSNLDSVMIEGLIIDYNGFIWAATDNGVYISTDKGAYWTLVDDSGLSSTNTLAIAINSNGFVYVGTDDGNVFKSLLTTTSNYNVTLVLNYRLSQNYPNPFNPITKIKFTISPQTNPLLGGDYRGGLTTLKVYDVLGNEISTLVNEEKPAGTYEVEFSATDGGSELTSGIYFYRLSVRASTRQAGQASSARQYAETKKMVLIK